MSPPLLLQKSLRRIMIRNGYTLDVFHLAEGFSLGFGFKFAITPKAGQAYRHGIRFGYRFRVACW